MNFRTAALSRNGFPTSHHWGVILAGAILVGCSPSPPAARQSQAVSKMPKPSGQAVAGNFPEFLADPLEPMNRGIWKFNEGVLFGILRPTGQVYRTIVPTPARRSISHFTRNITYPGRLINHALQGRWQGAGDESVRFICNSTVGVAGLFDVATKWAIPKSNADFAQTFNGWGWKPNTFVMLPLLGPSDDLHAAGLAADKVPEPWNFYRPLSYLSAGTTYNRLSDRTEDAVQFVQTEADPYVGTNYLWSYASKEESPNWATTGPKDLSTLQTLNVVNIRCVDPEFSLKGRETSVRLPSTGRKMKFNCWLQKQAAPLVYVAPGLGSHRVSPATLSIAELLYQNGFSVVTTTGVFHPEFMENASTAAIPAYPPVDSRDLLIYLTEIDRALEKKNPGRFGPRALVGFSMGGFQALHLAGREKSADPALLRFDRYVAIDAPVDLHYGVKKVDEFDKASRGWAPSIRQEKINNALHKAAKFQYLPPEQLANPPFDAIESKYLIGMSFRLTLRDTIYSSQSRNNMGIVQTPLSGWRRKVAYDEILNFSFRDYYLRFVVPYYKEKDIDTADFSREINLRSYQKSLASNSKIRVIANRDDFLLSPNDVSWLKSTFNSSRLTIFPNGGHLGNLASPPVQKAVVGALGGLK